MEHRIHPILSAVTSGGRTPRILEVCAVDFTAFHFLRPLMEACAAKGWEVGFACAPGPGAEALARMGFTYRPVPITRSRSPVRHLVAATALALGLRRDPVDLVHTHTPVGGLVGRIAAIASGAVAIHTFHGLPFTGALTLTDRAFLAVERVLAARTAFFFSQAGGDADRAAALGIARPQDTLVIGNGVDIGRFRPDPDVRAQVRRELGVPPDGVLVITVSRLVREKGLLELADAAQALATEGRLHVAIVGHALPSDRSDLTGALRDHPGASALGARWKMLGYRPDVHRLLQGADIFVLASYREGLPRSVIEAMASGLATVATAISACRELVEEGRTGLLVPVRDASALARAIGALIGDEALRSSMGRRARELAVGRHDERLVIERQLPVLARYLGA